MFKKSSHKEVHLRDTPDEGRRGRRSREVPRPKKSRKLKVETTIKESLRKGLRGERGSTGEH